MTDLIITITGNKMLLPVMDISPCSNRSSGAPRIRVEPNLGRNSYPGTPGITITINTGVPGYPGTSDSSVPG